MRCSLVSIKAAFTSTLPSYVHLMNSLDTSTFPIELIALIIHETWASSLTTFERARFIKNSLLVNSTWMKFFIHESCTNVHLVSGQYALHYGDIIDGKSAVYNFIARIDGVTVRRLCRSFTIHCIDPRIVPQPPETRCYVGPVHPMGVSAHIFVSRLQQGVFPNFNGHIVVQYSNKVPFTLMDLLMWQFPDTLKGVKRTWGLSTSEFWAVGLSGLNPQNATSLYDLLVAFLEIVTDVHKGSNIGRSPPWDSVTS
ncbi:hypothetical protein BDP27DRAFT_1312625 [Rhodocollybia butyracea]|uniref:Uncharacterized protein n=1 Tax=Rhodocollybia butyracea TaxID=206335 RepID=A0A9P5Q7B6_9AGAR|nr:hypothetical protein BDP27DRAFT_1312625 [Rhodocollybia butyracea]